MDYSKQLEKKNTPNDLYEYKKIVLDRISGNVLEIGCGTGRIMELMKHKAKSVQGIDVEKSCLTTCKKKGLNARYGNITKIPFANKRFDFVVCWNILEHLERDEIMTAAHEIMRVLKPGGRLILHSPAFSASFWDMPDHTYPVSEMKIQKLFNTAHNIEFLHYTIPKIRGFLISKLNVPSLYDFMLKFIPFRDRGMTVAVVTK